jgi:hypothetical protein
MNNALAWQDIGIFAKQRSALILVFCSTSLLH